MPRGGVQRRGFLASGNRPAGRVRATRSSVVQKRGLGWALPVIRHLGRHAGVGAPLGPPSADRRGSGARGPRLVAKRRQRVGRDVSSTGVRDRLRGGPRRLCLSSAFGRTQIRRRETDQHRRRVGSAARRRGRCEAPAVALGRRGRMALADETIRHARRRSRRENTAAYSSAPSPIMWDRRHEPRRHSTSAVQVGDETRPPARRPRGTPMRTDGGRPRARRTAAVEPRALRASSATQSVPSRAGVREARKAVERRHAGRASRPRLNAKGPSRS